MLTNDPSYWSPRNSHTVDSEFRLHEGRELQGSLNWGARAGEGTMRGREEPLRLSGSYLLRWEDYSQPGAGKHARFRYLHVEASGREGQPGWSPRVAGRLFPGEEHAISTEASETRPQRALVYYWCTRSFRAPEARRLFGVLPLRYAVFRSGRCWYRTSDLCRVKAALSR